MSISVQEAMLLEPFRRARLIAGQGGLDRLIRSVTVMDTPDIANWLKGNELLLSNIFVIRDDPKAQVALIKEIVNKGAAALGIKLKRFVDSIPQEMIELADELCLPIIEMPVDVAWIDVITPVLGEVLNRQLTALERSEEIHRRFTSTVLKGGGLSAIADNLAELIRFSVTITDAAFTVLAEAGAGAAVPGGFVPLGDLVRHLEEATEVKTPLGHSFFRVRLNGVDCLCCPVKAEQDLYGYLLVWLPAEAEVTERDTVAIEHGLTVTALEMVKRQAVSEVARRFQNNFILDLLTGNMESRETVIGRGKSFGWNLEVPYWLMILDIDEFERFYLNQTRADDHRAQRVREQFVNSVRRALVDEGFGEEAMTMDLSDSVTVLLPKKDERCDCKSIASRIKDRVTRDMKEVTVSAGIGRFYPDIMDLKRSYREAKQALTLGRAVWGRNSVIHFDDLGAYRVLCSITDREELLAFHHETIVPLLQYDEKTDSDLIRTLETYFSCQENIKATAQKMFIHPNTVRYRLNRISDLVGLSLERSEDRLNLQIGLKVHRLLGGKPRALSQFTNQDGESLAKSTKEA
ncbi:MAG: PucR family transcriptional regulator ligand-binding domain-containing protein [Bacillota bacterium]